MNINNFLTVTFTLFAVIDMLGAIPIIISLKTKVPDISAWKVTLASLVIMVAFLFFGQQFLKFLGIDSTSFAIAGSVVMFILGLEMVLGADFFHTDPDIPSASVVPVAFPIISGSGTLTTILSLKSAYNETEILAGIFVNAIIIFIVMLSTDFLGKKLGKATLVTIRKFFGVILLAIAVTIFRKSLGLL